MYRILQNRNVARNPCAKRWKSGKRFCYSTLQYLQILCCPNTTISIFQLLIRWVWKSKDFRGMSVLLYFAFWSVSLLSKKSVTQVIYCSLVNSSKHVYPCLRMYHYFTKEIEGHLYRKYFREVLSRWRYNAARAFRVVTCLQTWKSNVNLMLEHFNWFLEN